MQRKIELISVIKKHSGFTAYFFDKELKVIIPVTKSLSEKKQSSKRIQKILLKKVKNRIQFYKLTKLESQSLINELANQTTYFKISIQDLFSEGIEITKDSLSNYINNQK